MAKHKVVEAMSGCKIIETKKSRIMVGCPSDILKILLKKEIEIPDVIVLPTFFYLYGVVQANLEFILYYLLFAKNYLAQGKKLTVIGSESEIDRMRKILRICFLGPAEEEMVSWNIPRTIVNRTLKLAQHLGLKKPGTKEVALIDDLIDFLPYKNKKRMLGNISIEWVDINVFRFKEEKEETLVDINIAEAQKPPIPIPAPKEHIPRSVLGATALSKCATGFDQTGYTVGLIFWANGMAISVDGVSWMKEHLRVMGISPDEIRAHIITHIHDDHSNITDLIVDGKKFPLISDRLGYECLAKKLSLVLDISGEEIKKMIELIEIRPGEPLHWHGATIEIWPTVHPIPTFGVKITVANKSIMYSGDTVYGKKLKELLDAGAIGQELHDAVRDAPQKTDGLVFHDAGDGAVHPGLEEIATLASKTNSPVIPTHIQDIPKKLAHQFQPISAGQTWEIIPQNAWQAGELLQVLETPLLSGIEKNWRAAVISQGAVKEYSKGETIVEREGTGKRVYIIISGSARVLDEIKEEIAQLWTGDFFGEMAVMYDKPRNATIIATSPLKVLELPGDIFLEMAKSTGLYDSLLAIHQVRPMFLRFPTIKNLPFSVQNKIYSVATKVRVEAGDIIIRRGEVGDSLYGILRGKVNVVLNDRRLATLYRGHLFGEMALLENGIRTANVIAETDSELFIIPRENFDKLLGDTPLLRYILRMLIKDRQN
ncbi:cyclic nucleotide-binding domain-containing protein [Patescibacteria group bacterium]|nr:cyclic nucleotide-binding domain-containing protein [Patescibacteria group bacterium]